MNSSSSVASKVLRVAILDPSFTDSLGAPTPNAGDQIIARAVLREVKNILPESVILRFPTHVRLSEDDRRTVSECDWIIVGGSNLLGNPQFSRRRLRYWQQWALTGRDAASIGRAILLGAGWREYEPRVHPRARRLYRRVLADQPSQHSVRDGYTARKLASIGLANVVSTSCPTLWPLGEASGAAISADRADVVLTTVTDYRRDPSADFQVQRLLMRRYRHVYLWPQGSDDLAYLRSWDEPIRHRITVLDPGLASLDQFLGATHCDYLGTRLHCGIHCLNAGKRSLILAIDNRATEIAADTNLPVLNRDDLDGIDEWVTRPTRTHLTLDRRAIAQWRGQFSDE